MTDTIYRDYPPDYAAIVRAEEDRITAALAATPTHRLHLPAAILTFRQAGLPLLDIMSANTHADLSPEIIIDHLRARAMTEATAVIDSASSQVAEAQRFASARFRETVEVARRSQRIRGNLGKWYLKETTVKSAVS